MAVEQYLNILQAMIYSKISLSIYKDTEEEIIDNMVNNIMGMNIPGFHKYYFDTINNEDYYLTEPQYFREFAHRWKLRVDDEYCNHLELNKDDILNHIKEDHLAVLYYNYFKICDKGDLTEKQCRYFLSKLLHTFHPHEYAPVDNLILDFFDLKTESYYIAFEIISKTYRIWLSKHAELVDKITIKLTESDNLFLLNKEKLTGIRLLDLNFMAMLSSKNK
jgi:hypothetical protein